MSHYSRLPRPARRALVALSCLLALGAPTFAAPPAPAQMAGDAEIAKRVDALLAQMTLQEKIGQLTQLFLFAPQMYKGAEDRVRKGEIGSFLFVTDAAAINPFQKVAVGGSRRKIPILFGFDVIHGFRTQFPVPLAMASSFDPKAVERAQTVAAREASAVGVRWPFAPMVDIARDARWGRIVEGAGEDPYLGSAMAAAQVRGFQGTRS